MWALDLVKLGSVLLPSGHRSWFQDNLLSVDRYWSVTAKLTMNRKY